MDHLKTGKLSLIAVFVVLGLCVLLSVVSFFPATSDGIETTVVLDDCFRLTMRETFRQGLGSFHGDESITLWVTGTAGINFTLLTYGGAVCNTIGPVIEYTFSPKTDYYEAMFSINSIDESADVHFQMFVNKPSANFPFSWLGEPARIGVIISWAISMLFLLRLFKQNSREEDPKRSNIPVIRRKNLHGLKIVLLVSLLFWFVLLFINTYPLATFENWYTDSARHPYTSVLFSKTGFSVFNVPLGRLSNLDSSFYKYVTWADMPHLYPLGSIFLFLPFGALLEIGVNRVLIFKLEIGLFLIISHICLYLFLRHFWKEELESAPKDSFLEPLKQRKPGFALKAVGTYLLYILLIVYAANGQFDSIAVLLTLFGVLFFLNKRDDFFLLFMAVASTFKYQAGMFLFPLIMVSVLRIVQQEKPKLILKNKVILAAIGLFSIDLFTAFMSSPFLMNVRSEFIMNILNAFSLHSQVSWPIQSAVLILTVIVTLSFALYMLGHNGVISLFAVFTLLPCFFMPYFQPWYLPFFFLYLMIPQKERSLSITLIWLFFIVFVLSFGGFSFNPLGIIDNIRKVMGL